MIVVVTAAVEGTLDESLAIKIIEDAGGVPGPIYGKGGKAALRRKVSGYNEAARRSPWLVLVDLDHDEQCAPPLCQAWLPAPAELMRLRVAVREAEAWLMADRERFARFLGVRQGALPRDPESVEDPKQLVVNLARGSRKRDIRADLVPRPEGGRIVGPAYTSRLIEYITEHWRPAVASLTSGSLDRCRTRLHELVEALS